MPHLTFLTAKRLKQTVERHPQYATVFDRIHEEVKFGQNDCPRVLRDEIAIRCGGKYLVCVRIEACSGNKLNSLI